MTHFRGFDGLRAIAILLVILWHGGISTRFPTGKMGLLEPVFGMGWAGVDLFFALSGFLITSLILREEARNESAGGPPRFSLARFYMRRVFRILPAFYFVFALDSLILARFPGMFPSVRTWQIAAADSPLGLWPYATFWGNYFINYPPHGAASPGLAFTVFWSLCVEEHFYVLWPLCLTFARRARTRLLAALAACGAILALRAVMAATGAERPGALHAVSHYRIDAVLWGSIAAIVFASRPIAQRPRRIALLAVASAIVVLVATGQMSVVPPGTWLGVSLGLTLLAVGGALLVTDLAAAPTSRIARLLELPPLQAVGRVSYGMYLLHFPAIDVAGAMFFSTPRKPGLLGFLWLYLLICLCTFAAAWILYQIVEAPFLRLKVRWHA